MTNDTVELAGRRVHRIGYGAMQIAHGRQLPSHEEAVSLLRTVDELGVDHIDTADFYGDSTVNRAIAEAFPSADDSPLIATKLGARRRAGGTGLVPAQSPAELREDVQANLRSLRRERLDLVYIRRADVGPGIVATDAERFPLADQLAELITLRDQGLIAAIGLSHVDAAQVGQGEDAGVVAVQNMRSLLERGDEAAFEVGREHEMAWVPFFPLGSGFEGRPKVTDLPLVAQAARDLDATPEQVGLAWLLREYDHTLLIPGSLNPQHVAQNLAAERLDLGEWFSRLNSEG